MVWFSETEFLLLQGSKIKTKKRYRAKFNFWETGIFNIRNYQPFGRGEKFTQSQTPTAILKVYVFSCFFNETLLHNSTVQTLSTSHLNWAVGSSEAMCHERFFSLYEQHLFPKPNYCSCISKTNTHTYAQEYLPIVQEHFWPHCQ